MTTGEATMDDWLKKLKDNNTSLINSIESSRKNNPRYNGGVDGDPIALSLEERLAYAEKWDLPLIQFHPTEELRDMMYQVEVKEVFNQETGKYEDDWDTFFLHLEMIEQAAGSEFVEEVRKLADVDRTDLGKTHKLISRTLFKAWNLTYDVVKETFSEEEQEVIARHRAADNEFERQAYAAVPSSTNPETTVVALFRRQLTEMRTNIREVDPDLDAWLAFFQRVQTVKTPQARERLIEIRSSFNLRTVTEL
jgi:predicted restriction endonuclease